MKNKFYTTAALVALITATVVLCIPTTDASGASTENIHSYTIHYAFSGEGAISISWDFGDGETSTDFSGEHTYSEIGTYTIKQTVTNKVGTSTAEKTINVLGDPIVTFVTNCSTTIDPITVPYVDGEAQTINGPSDPRETGKVFMGWYTDKLCTKAWSFETPVSESITLYASWVSGYIISVMPTTNGIITMIDGVNENLNLYIPINVVSSSSDAVIETAVFEKLSSSNKTLYVTVYQNGSISDVCYKLTFNGSNKITTGNTVGFDLYIAEQNNPWTDIELTATDALSPLMGKYLKTAGENGTLPFEVGVEYHTGNNFGSFVNVYHLNINTLDMVTTSSLINGVVSFTMAENGNYEILSFTSNEKASEMDMKNVMIIAVIVLIVAALVAVFLLKRNKEEIE